jgi:hypothetical protein
MVMVLVVGGWWVVFGVEREVGAGGGNQFAGLQS